MIKNILTEELKDCLNRNSRPGVRLGDNLHQLLSAAKSDEKLLPVVGTQGMGKSTLINAILGEDIMPNAADETTCVPVEVAYGQEEYAEVYFRDSKRVKRIFTKNELNSYVDNNENPANEKGVEHIRLFRNSQILKSGLIIVDLPGVGSVTSANEDTTKRYIENVRCAVFVIPTVPTIRRTEALFIRGAWSQFNNAIFVQNDFGETEVEKRDSVDHNTKILSQMAEQYSLTFEKPIFVINAYNALVGKIKNQENLVSKSDINSLTTKISSMAKEWETNLLSALQNRLMDILSSSLAEAKRKLHEAHSAEEKNKEERKARFEQQKKEIDNILKTIDEIEVWLQQERLSIRKIISDEVKKTGGRIRAEMTKVINDGTVDGDNLNHAFDETQTHEVETFSAIATDTLINFATSFKEKMLDLIDEIGVQEGMRYDSVDFESKEKLKWEKGVNSIAKWGGAAVGAIGAKAAAIALLGSNPAGWAIAAVGFGIYAIASLFGWGVKKSVMAKRKEEAKKAVFPKIDEIEQHLKKSIFSKIDETVNNAETQLEELRKTKKEEVKSIRDEMRNPIQLDEIPVIESDINLIQSVLTKI